MTNNTTQKMYLLNILKGKWRIPIIEELFTGAKQFSELESALNGISAKVLSDNLQYLAKAGVICKKTYPVFHRKVEYSLSDTGLKLKPVLDSIFTWSMENYVPYSNKVMDEYDKIFIL